MRLRRWLQWIRDSDQLIILTANITLPCSTGHQSVTVIVRCPRVRQRDARLRQSQTTSRTNDQYTSDRHPQYSIHRNVRLWRLWSLRLWLFWLSASRLNNLRDFRSMMTYYFNSYYSLHMRHYTTVTKSSLNWTRRCWHRKHFLQIFVLQTRP